jgi:hypothetical protein
MTEHTIDIDMKTQYSLYKMIKNNKMYCLYKDGKQASSLFERPDAIKQYDTTLLMSLIHYTQEQQQLQYENIMKAIAKQQETIENISKRLHEMEERIEFAPVDGNSEYDKAKSDYDNTAKQYK